MFYLIQGTFLALRLGRRSRHRQFYSRGIDPETDSQTDRTDYRKGDRWRHGWEVIQRVMKTHPYL